jgi:hypothetical protein
METIAQGPSLLCGQRHTDVRVVLMPLYSCGVTDDASPDFPLRSADTLFAVANVPRLCSQYIFTNFSRIIWVETADIAIPRTSSSTARNTRRYA